MANILIIGGSRGIGLEAVKQSLARGHVVRALARSADRIALDDPKLEKRAGNALDPIDMSSALEGMEAVILAIGLDLGPKLVLGPVRLFSKSTQILVTAMEESGVQRLICVTGFGTGESRNCIGCLQYIPFRLLLGRAYNDKDVQEQIIRSSKLDWVVARPGILTNGAKTGRYRILVAPEQWRNGFISRTDVADFLVRQVEDRTYVGKLPVLTF